MKIDLKNIPKEKFLELARTYLKESTAKLKVYTNSDKKDMLREAYHSLCAAHGYAALSGIPETNKFYQKLKRTDEEVCSHMGRSKLWDTRPVGPYAREASPAEIFKLIHELDGEDKLSELLVP